MVFILLFTGMVAVARFWADHWEYAVAAVVLCTVGALFLYRAAVASARAYGATLLTISRYSSSTAA